MSEFKAGDRVKIVKGENGKDWDGPVGIVDRVSTVGGNYCHVYLDGTTRILGSTAIKCEHLIVISH